MYNYINKVFCRIDGTHGSEVLKMTDDITAITQAVALNLASQGFLQPQKKRKARVNWESLYIREYLVRNYPKNLKWIRHEIGPYNPNNPAEFNGQLRRWADAIIDIDDTILLVEAKMRPDVKAIAQIDLYRNIFPQTPEFEYYADKPLRVMLLTTSVEPNIKDLAEKWGIEYEIYVPSFWNEYQQMLINRYKKEQ